MIHYPKTEAEKALIKAAKAEHKKREKMTICQRLAYDFGEDILEKHVTINDKAIMVGVLEDEKELENDYPVHPDYTYVVTSDVFPDGVVIRSDVFGDVLKLKRDLADYRKWKNIVVYNCDRTKRNLW